VGQNRVSYTLDSSLEGVNQAEDAAGKFVLAAGGNEDELQAWTMAVREATINAVLHGNHYDPDKKVQLTFERERCGKGWKLRVMIRDQGQGFDAGAVPDPRAPENMLRPCGRGIFLIRAYVDEVKFRNLHPGTEVVITKNVGDIAAHVKEKKES
jgi:serine/threonine-protein kinase RsbW